MVPATIDRCTKPDSVKLIPISSLEGLCPGKAIMFFCRININANSTHLVWHSEEYIRDQLAFLTINNILFKEDVIMDPMFNDTVATYNATGTSLLVLKPRADTPNATITCRDVNTGCNNSIPFHLLGTYH